MRAHASATHHSHADAARQGRPRCGRWREAAPLPRAPYPRQSPVLRLRLISFTPTTSPAGMTACHTPYSSALGGSPPGGVEWGGAKNRAGIHCLANREALQQACELAGPEISAGWPSRTEPPPHL